MKKEEKETILGLLESRDQKIISSIDEFEDATADNVSASNYIIENGTYGVEIIKTGRVQPFSIFNSKISTVFPNSLLKLLEENENIPFRVYVSGTGNTVIAHSLDMSICYLKKYDRTDEQDAKWHQIEYSKNHTIDFNLIHSGKEVFKD